MRKLLCFILLIFTFQLAQAEAGKTHKYTSTIRTNDANDHLEMFFVKGHNSKGPNGLVILLCGVRDTEHKYRTAIEFNTTNGKKLIAEPITAKGDNNIDRYKDVVYFECYFKETDLPIIMLNKINTITISGKMFEITESGHKKILSLIEKMFNNENLE